MKTVNSLEELKNEVNKKGNKKRRKPILIYILLGISIIIFIYSLVQIGKWFIDSNNTKEEINDIVEDVEVIEVEDNDNTEVIENYTPDPNNPYWKFIKMNLIDVDFDELKKQNSDVRGWIQVNGTNINYPFVQASDNDYYLTHGWKKNKTDAGWLFMDYRNNVVNFDDNTIIYGHSRLDSTMFGTLKNVVKNGWLKNSDNYVIKLSTEYENTLWQVFSVYRINTTTDYLKINFTNDDERVNFYNMLKNRSEYNFGTELTKDDKILTLSTCYSDNKKTVLHAKLIKREVKNKTEEEELE